MTESCCIWVLLFKDLCFTCNNYLFVFEDLLIAYERNSFIHGVIINMWIAYREWLSSIAKYECWGMNIGIMCVCIFVKYPEVESKDQRTCICIYVDRCISTILGGAIVYNHQQGVRVLLYNTLAIGFYCYLFACLFICSFIHLLIWDTVSLSIPGWSG